MNLRTMSRTVVALLAAASLLTGAANAFAAGPRIARVNTPPPLPGAPAPAPNVPVPLTGERGPIPAGVKVAGRDIGGLTESEARSVIAAIVRAASLPQLDVVLDGRTSTLWPAKAFYADTASILDEAYAATGPVDIAPRFVVNTRTVRAFINSVARGADRPATDARWSLDANNRVKFTHAATGRRVERAAMRRLVLAALNAEARTGQAQPAVTVPVTAVRPKWTDDTIGRAILVVIAERKLRLFETDKIVKTYSCAVGMPGYPTPVGNFRIIEKRYLPTWVNPAVNGWGAGMPAVIGPGPGNPLGTRALNLNSPGIRIHGTENIASLGTAASHGCVRLARRDIEELYELVSVGTPVFIVGR